MTLEYNFTHPEDRKPLADRTHTQIRLGLRELAAAEKMQRTSNIETPSYTEKLLEEAADRMFAYESLLSILGLLAPRGTTPATALEQLYKQSLQGDVTVTETVYYLRNVFDPHFGDRLPINQ